MGTAPSGLPHTGQQEIRQEQQEAGHDQAGQPITAEVERHLERLDHLPLVEHPRVYEHLDAAIRRELETEPRA